MGMEDGPSLYPPAGRARPAGAASAVAGIASLTLPDCSGVGHRERRPLRGAGAAHGRRLAARRIGQGAGDRTRADPGRTGGAGGARPLSRRPARSVTPLTLLPGLDPGIRAPLPLPARGEREGPIAPAMGG